MRESAGYATLPGVDQATTHLVRSSQDKEMLSYDQYVNYPFRASIPCG